MTTKEEAFWLLEELRNAHVTKTWASPVGDETEHEIIARGLDSLESSATPGCLAVLHGWIDQAVLEIIAIQPIADLRQRALTYRADQGGDTGVLIIIDGKAVVLEISLEDREISICEYERAQP